MTEKTITKEFAEKVKQARSAEELLAVAKENGFQLDKAQASAVFAKRTELSDQELEQVAGGHFRLPGQTPGERDDPDFI